MKLLKNPFYLYIISFSTVLLIYQLEWSSLFPELSSDLLIFFLVSFFIALFLGIVSNHIRPIKYQQIRVKRTIGKTIRNVTIVLIFLYICEFIYNKGVPFILVLGSEHRDYTQFGIPTLHSILVTFTSFFTVYIFHIYLSTKKKKILIYLMFYLIIPVLIYNRGMLLIILSSFFIIFLMSINKFKFKQGIVILSFILILFYSFGVLGDYRIRNKFVNVGQATESFKNSKIPEEFFWSFIYISSPLANLQNNINMQTNINYDLTTFIFTELTPDFISKRISAVLDLKKARIFRVAEFLTVGTVFGKSYTLLGWLGMSLIFLFIMGLTFFYLFFLKKSSRFYITGIALLCSFTVFNTFDNMIYFSGMGFQLIYPLVFSINIGLKFKNHDGKK